MFQEYNISALTEVPALIGTFAAALGWTVTGTPTVPIVQAPAPGAIPFTVQYVLRGSGSGVRQTIRTFNTALDYAAVFNSPRRRDGVNSSTPVHVQPTKLIMIGGATPQPWLAAIVCYGFNLYRHLYIGRLEKIGNYTDGDVLAAATDASNSAFSSSYRSSSTQYLFNASGNTGTPWLDGEVGAVRLTHADNPTPRRRFRQTADNITSSNMTADGVIGGFKDDINDGYLMRGQSSYAGAVILVPINLYAVRPSSRISPIGRPPGVRMVRMNDFNPESTVSIGGEDWFIVPQFRKSELTTVDYVTSGFPTDETSYSVGIAYRKEM